MPTAAEPATQAFVAGSPLRPRAGSVALGASARRRLQSNSMEFCRSQTLRQPRRLVPAALAMFVCSLAIAEEPAPGPSAAERVTELIANLGSDEYALRESASDELARIGLPAFSALESAALHPDREVRFRSQRVLSLIRQHDVQRRLEAFLVGQEASGDNPFPGWSRFRKAYGDDPQSRALFVSIQRAEPELMAALESGARPAADLLGQRANQHRQTLQADNQQLSLGQVAATLFVAAQEDIVIPSQTMNALLSHCHQPSFRDSMSAPSRREIPKKMLGAVIRRSDEAAAFQAMSVAYQYNMPEGIAPAEKILSAPAGSRSAPMAQLALMTVARLGDLSHLPLVEKLLSDGSQLSRMQDNTTVYDVQLRDAALAAAVILTKQDIKAYFDVPGNQSLSDPQMIFFNARVIGFASAEKRAAVFEKWAKYRAQQASAPAGQKF